MLGIRSYFEDEKMEDKITKSLKEMGYEVKDFRYNKNKGDSVITGVKLVLLKIKETLLYRIVKRTAYDNLKDVYHTTDDKVIKAIKSTEEILNRMKK